MDRRIIRLSFFVLAISVLLAMQGCYYDNEQELYPNTGTCDTTAVTYSLTITPIIQNSCYTCHSNATAATSGASINLEGHVNLSAYITTNPTLFLDAIQHTGTTTPMPVGGGALSSCNISQIKTWMHAGMPNN